MLHLHSRLFGGFLLRKKCKYRGDVGGKKLLASAMPQKLLEIASVSPTCFSISNFSEVLTMSNSANIEKQWELACDVYAWHQVSIAFNGKPQHQVVKEKLIDSLNTFLAEGGKTQKKTDPLGVPIPCLVLSNGDEVPYSIDHARCDVFSQQILS